MAPEPHDTSSSQPQNIALLGSTGFLGPYIVVALLRKHSHYNSILNSHSRLGLITTDITKPDLGLNEADHRLILSNVDEIVFNAWNPNWGIPLKSFEPLLGALSSAIEISRASPRRPRITFMSSTCSIAEWPRQHPTQPLYPELPAWDEASVTDNGYGKSKYQAEQLLAHAHTEHGLRVAIVRAGNIGGPSRSAVGPTDWPIQGWLFVVIKTSQRLGYWPTHINALDWIPVDTLAAGIANITGTQPDNSEAKVYNMMHPDPAPWSMLYNTLTDKFGLVAEEMRLPVWLDLLDPVKFKMHAFFRGAGEGREEESKVFENANALGVFPDVERITAEQLEVWMKRWDLRLGEMRAKI
ncbi:ochratoxin a non-ribosomal peptide synthetase protein [Stemphylium lycopersici]|nr:ochratoxin a non-ribosomal peptide synthetase protein [Stemphylium lycopersici]